MFAKRQSLFGAIELLRKLHWFICRHVGDLENIEAGEDGLANVNISLENAELKDLVGRYGVLNFIRPSICLNEWRSLQISFNACPSVIKSVSLLARVSEPSDLAWLRPWLG